MEKIRVLIADDHSMVREGLKQLIEMEDDIKVIAQAGDGEETIEKIKTAVPDIVLLDINMPKKNGLDVLRTVRDENDNCKIIILTIHNEVEYLFKALELKADGYVLKDSGSDVLIQAIREVYSGSKFIQPSMFAKWMQKENEQDEEDQSKILTKREIEVLKLITEGMLNKEIAHRLNISEKTVKNHISNIFKKIEVCDRTQAAVYAIRHSVVDVFELKRMD